MRDRRTSIGVTRVILGFVLAGAGVMKAGNAAAFAEGIANYRIFPAVIAQGGAVILPWMELCSGVLLVTGLWLRASAGIATALFGIFTLAVLSALVRGLDISCGCFGTSSSLAVSLPTLALDVLGLGAGLYLLRCSVPPRTEVPLL